MVLTYANIAKALSPAAAWKEYHVVAKHSAGYFVANVPKQG